MIGFLRGTVRTCTPATVLLDVGGVGYFVHIPLSTFYEIEKVGDAEIALHVHTHVREDALSLFGFWSEDERHLFEKLIGISGIGPKLAQTILSGIPPGELATALAGSDFRRLNAIPGVGRKTAERMVLELKDKMGDVATPAAATPPTPSTDDDVRAALLNLGYRRATADRALAAARTELGEAADSAPFTDLLKKTLGHLSRT